MSKKHSFSDPLALTGFLNLVAKRNGWNRSTAVLRNGEILFTQIFTLKVENTTSAVIAIQLMLVPHNKLSGVNLLCNFGIKATQLPSAPTIRVVQGQAVLTHYAKRFAQRQDCMNPLTGDTWEIRCPANLEALFRAYNNVAWYHDAIPLFNLP